MSVLGKRKAEDSSVATVDLDSDNEDNGESETIVQNLSLFKENPFLESDSPLTGEVEVSYPQASADLSQDRRLADYVQAAKKVILDRISERSLPDSLDNLTTQYDKLFHLLEQTVKTGESNSCLLVGNRGSGKSTLVRKAIEELRKDHKDNFLVVELNGLVQTDDKSALREITRQLTRESQMEGRSFVSFVIKLMTEK